MSAAAASAVIVLGTGLTVTLVDEAGDVAASFTLVGWHIVGVVFLGVSEASHIERVLLWSVVDLVVLENAVVNLWSESSWAEAALDDSMAGLSAVAHGCTAAAACAVIVFLAWHAFALVIITVGGAWLFGLFTGLLWCRWGRLNFWCSLGLSKLSCWFRCIRFQS